MWPAIIVALLGSSAFVCFFLFALPEDYINYTPLLWFRLTATWSAVILISLPVFIAAFFHTFKSSSWHIIAILLAALLTSFLSLHFFFSQVFAAIGLFGPNGITHNKWDALYFSIITWTTTGYGDFRPIGDGRWYACVEALLGTFFNGFVVVAFIYHLTLLANQE